MRRRFMGRSASISPRTIARILKRAKLVRERRKRRPINVVDRAPRVEANSPNEVWTVDFKGWWRAVNGQRCEPLTVRDAHSRYVLAVELCPATLQAVKQDGPAVSPLRRVPGAIQCDNGVPFISARSRAGLSGLSAWWISLGIRLVRSRPACPQDNGAHERMHHDIRAEAQRFPARDTEQQQEQLDRWRQEFNHVRPHGALANRSPAEAYKPAERREPKPLTYSYPAHMAAAKVQANGMITIQGKGVLVSESLRGHRVAHEPVDAT